jgi:hypothetical protein
MEKILKKLKKNHYIILIFLLLICISIEVFKLRGYRIQNRGQCYKEFINNDLKLILREFNLALSKNNIECSNDVITYMVERSLCDSCSALILYDIANKTLTTAWWKIQYEENEINKIDIWDIEINKNIKNNLYYCLGKYIRQINIVPEMTDGETVYVCYKSKVFIFKNPRHGISPYDFYVKHVIY